MIQGIVKPLIPANTKSAASLRQFADALRKKDPILANAFERAQQNFDRLEGVLRSEPQQADETVITDSDGNVIAWIGSREGYFGGWFGQLYVGETGPADAPFFVQGDGTVVIGKNGSVVLLDPAGNPVGWLGTESEAGLVITGATNATPIVVTIVAHGYENGDTLYIAGATGNTALNGYRIVKNTTADTFEITDLAGVDVAGNGVYAGLATAIRYFGGGLFQTFAVGGSFPNYKFRAFADGSLKIKDALITLTSGTKSIILDPSHPDFQFNDADSKLEISGTGGGTHQITLVIVDDSDPNLYTAYLSSQGILTLKGYTHQAQIGVTNYGSDPVVYLSRAGGTVATPAAPSAGDILGGLDFSAYDAGAATFVKANAIMSRQTASGAEISFENDLSAPSVVIDPTAQTMVVNDGTLTTGYQFDVKGAALFRNDVDVTGKLTLLDSGLTASRPLKINSSDEVVTAKIDTGDAADIAATGFSSNDLARWDGTKFVPLTIASLATELASYFAAAGVLGTGHTLTMAKVTAGGTDGAIQFNASGQLVAYVDPT